MLKKKRPEIKYKIYEAEKSRKTELWKAFAKYHYLSHTHNNAAKVFVLTINDVLAGFYSVLKFPHPRVKNMYRGHRLVVLPDFQGIGAGIFLQTEIAKLYVLNNKRFSFSTSHPAIIAMYKKSKNWKMIFYGRTGRVGKIGLKAFNKTISGTNRITTSWEYKTIK